MATAHEEVLAVHDRGVENRLFVRSWAPAQASRGTVVCLHGLCNTGLDFEAMAEALVDRGLTVVCPDMPGHGQSRWAAPAEMARGGPCGMENVARCLAGLLAHYVPEPTPRYLIASSWSGMRLALFLARHRVPARRVVLNDIALERLSFHGEILQWVSAESELSFDTLDAGIACIDRRHRVLLRNRDSDVIDPALLRRYLASQLTLRDGRYVMASNPFREGVSSKLQLGYPDFHAALSANAAERILLLFGGESPHRDNATYRRIMETLPNVRSATVPHAGHGPRLLTPYEWNLVGDFLLEP